MEVEGNVGRPNKEDTSKEMVSMEEKLPDQELKRRETLW
jgi:hypothetical protein